MIYFSITTGTISHLCFINCHRQEQNAKTVFSKLLLKRMFFPWMLSHADIPSQNAKQWFWCLIWHLLKPPDPHGHLLTAQLSKVSPGRGWRGAPRIWNSFSPLVHQLPDLLTFPPGCKGHLFPCPELRLSLRLWIEEELFMGSPLSNFMLLFLIYVVGARRTAEMPRDAF